ncbi:MAG: DUF3891 family protein [bacterium]
MIVRRRNNDSVCVTQTEHARLSKDMFDQFSHFSLEPLETAIRHHDDGWKEYDKAPSLEDGSLVDYRSVPLNRHLTILQRSVDRCATRNAYAGWLVSKHGCSFHENKTTNSVKTFLDDQEVKRKTLSESIRPDLKENSGRDFNWLQFTDALSLFVLDPWEETLEWDRDHPGHLTVTRLNEGVFSLETASLSARTCSFNYSYRRITVGRDVSETTVRDRLSSRKMETGQVTLRVEQPA